MHMNLRTHNKFDRRQFLKGARLLSMALAGGTAKRIAIHMFALQTDLVLGFPIRGDSLAGAMR